MKLIGSSRSNKIRGLSISYSSGMEVWIVPKSYSYMVTIDPARTWNITLFKKEVASDITVICPDHNSLTGHYP